MILGTGLAQYSDVVRVVLRAIGVFVLAYFAALTLSYLAITIGSAIQTYRYFRRRSGIVLLRVLRSRMTPPITICIPAYNEEETIVSSIRAMLTLHYPQHEVAVTNDGSTDRTLDRLIAAFNMRRVDQATGPGIPTAPIRGIYRSLAHPNLIVVDKENGGRSDALNCSMNVAHTPIVCFVDADSILEPDGLLAAVHPFIEFPDITCGVGGIIRVANGCRIEEGQLLSVGLPRQSLALFQTVEYMRAFLAARSGWSGLGGLLIISGAFGVFRRSDVLAVGGFAADSIGEDFELCVRLHRRNYDERNGKRLLFVPDPVCWTEVPTSLRDLGGQRHRWHRGLVDTLWRHRDMVGNPRYGAVGMVSLPFFALFEFLGAFIEAGGYVIVPVGLLVGAVNLPFALLFFAVAILSGVLLSLSAVLLEDLAFRRYGRLRELFLLIGMAVLENFGYRQILTIYRVRGFFAYLRGDTAWGTIRRAGFDDRTAV
ncbi:MAG: glycosyltransferase [Actinomycetota bacterium]|nr:glycosyltransferase [Actinomycetota bacterium]